MILASRIDIRKPWKHRNEIQCECLVSNVKFNLHVYKNLTLKTTTYTVILPNQSVALLAHIRLKYVSAVLFSLSHKTVNAKENFWNVYCFAANQTWDETAKDDRQTAAGISHDLIRNNELAVFLLQEIFNIPFGSLWKSYFLTTNQHQSLDSICSKTKLPE